MRHRPADVFGEIDRRERVYGIAEKLPKQASAAQARRLLAGGARRKALVLTRARNAHLAAAAATGNYP